MSRQPVIFNAFELHDTHGFPLDLAIVAAQTHGASINLAAFACDALAAGWTEEKIKTTFETANPSFDWALFRQKLATLWAVTGKVKDPDCWKVMKQAIVAGRITA